MSSSAELGRSMLPSIDTADGFLGLYGTGKQTFNRKNMLRNQEFLKNTYLS
jgi:hypothetical protein